MTKGALVLGLEDTGSRMTRLGKGELVYGELLTVDELLDRVGAVTPEQVRAVAADLLGAPIDRPVRRPRPHGTGLT
jgi:predicted Zn-dependent peptidase